MKKTTILFVMGLSVGFAFYCSPTRKSSKNADQKQLITTNINGNGTGLILEFERGKNHNHPVMAVWLEDTDGNYIQTLFVARSIAKGVFGHGDTSRGVWMPGKIRRPAALPYWSHKRNIRAADGLFTPDESTAVPDAYTAATPAGSFILDSKSDQPLSVFRILLEINQPWDWNSFWHNNKYPDDNDYKTSCQPALVYAAEINTNSGQSEYILMPIGHSHYSGKNGQLFTELSTITTALDITGSVKVRIK